MQHAIERVTDIDDPRIAPFRSLRERELRTTDGAREHGWFVAEGKLILDRLLASRFRVRSVFLESQRIAEMEPRLARLPAGTPIYAAERELHERVTGARFHQGLLALGEEGAGPDVDALLARSTRLVVLEGLVSHDNVGSVFRNVAALAGPASAVLLDPRCADPLYRRSIRVSMGWVLDVPFARLAPWPEALERVKQAGFRLIALTPSADAVDIERAVSMRSPRVALMIGAEDPGLTRAALESADMRVKIPISAGVDSINLATAAAIALHRFGAG